VGIEAPKKEGLSRNKKIFFVALCCSSLIIFLFIIHTLDGSPIRRIKIGEYQVAEVYNDNRIGDVVVLTKENKGAQINFYSYQLPRNEFEGEIKADAVKLEVFRLETKVGNFKKFRLE